MSDDIYQQLGASASKAGLHAALKDAGFTENPGVFIKLNADLSGDKDYYSFLHCDGAGTKSIVAYLLARETGDISHFAGLAQDALVMNLDDCLCAGLPGHLLLANTVARNRNLISDEALTVLLTRYRSLVELLNKSGVSIELAGGETADCGDTVRTLVVDAVLGGRIHKKNVIDTARIAAGDAIVGISSTGQASYESVPNSGIGSNGLTLARHALLKKDYRTRFPEVVDPALDQKAAYAGPFGLLDTPKNLGMSVGAALLSPTRTYAPLLVRVLKELGEAVHGVIHVTGGGATKILRFGKQKRYVKNNLFPVPPLFSLIQEHGRVPLREMYQVFNMGHRLEIYLPEKDAGAVMRIAKEFSLEAKTIGTVEPLPAGASANQVIVESPHGKFEYDLKS